MYSKMQEKKFASAEKLFSLIIYKNMVPKDFSQLSLNRGLLYYLVNSKTSFIEHINAAVKKDVDEIESKLANDKNIVIKEIKQLRTLYLRKIEEKITIDHANIDYNTLCNDQNFNSIRVNNHFTSYRSSYFTANAIEYNFSEIEKIIDPNETYLEKEARILDLSKYNQDTIRLKELKGVIINNITLCLAKLINTYPLYQSYIGMCQYSCRDL